jgi:hypothetical protein
LWSEDGRRQPGATLIELLEKASKTYDFAVIILARDDVIGKGVGDTLKARDNCIFAAGLFMAALGQDRCFLVNSVEQRDLPSGLGGIISIPFEEPSDLADPRVSARAISQVATVLKDTVQRRARLRPRPGRLLSVEELFQRERPYSDGGDLHEGHVVVYDRQPMGPEQAVQVRRNLDSGISYLYILYFSEDAIEKTCQCLQVVLTSGSSGTEKATDFNARLHTISKEANRIEDDLRRICRTRSLRVSLFTLEPQFCFRIHNASDRALARLYLRFQASGFMMWAEGTRAESVWGGIDRFIPADEHIFVPMKQFDLTDEQKRRFEISLDRGLKRYFPGIEDRVRQFCVGPKPL